MEVRPQQPAGKPLRPKLILCEGLGTALLLKLSPPKTELPHYIYD